MKKQFLLWVCGTITFHIAKAQVVNASGGYIVQTGNYVVLQDVNLVNNGTFNPSAGSVRFSGTSNTTINGTASPAFYTLEINKNTGNQVTLQSNISVNNSINFLSGLIELSGNNIILNGTAYLNNESETSRITGITGGYVQATATLNAPSSANPGNLGAVISTAENPGITVIRRGHVSQLNASGAGNSIYRYYDILPATQPSAYTLRLNYFDAELNGLSESTLTEYKSNNTLTWFTQGHTSRDAAANYVEYAGIAGYYQRWTLSSVGNVLPLALLSFKANCLTDAVNLKWTTAGNTSSGAFKVQRSNDGMQWQTIAVIQAGAASQYSYTDVSGNSKCFYRLQLPEEDNHVAYSDIKSSNCAIFKNSSTIYPNPATNFVQLQLSNIPDKEVSLILYSGSGQLLIQRSISITGTVTTYTLPVINLPSGIYQISLKSTGYKKMFSFVKQ